MKESKKNRNGFSGLSYENELGPYETPPLLNVTALLSDRLKPEPLYRRNYAKNTIQDSSALLKVIRAFQPELLSGKERNVAIIKLIEKYVINDYVCKVHEAEGYQILKEVLNEDMLIAVKGLRAIATTENLKELNEVDNAIERDVKKYWRKAESII